MSANPALRRERKRPPATAARFRPDAMRRGTAGKPSGGSVPDVAEMAGVPGGFFPAHLEARLCCGGGIRLRPTCRTMAMAQARGRCATG